MNPKEIMMWIFVAMSCVVAVSVSVSVAVMAVKSILGGKSASDREVD